MILNTYNINIEMLEKEIGYVYKDKNLLLLALTHSSYANENKQLMLQSNERIEFLGDAVLDLVISEYLYLNDMNLSEGELTKVRSAIVCEASLAECAMNINLGDYILLGKGEENTGGRNRVSLLCDAFEAVIGSIFLDGGMDNARKFILKKLSDNINKALSGTSFIDYKTKLQELIQKEGNKKIVYRIVDEKGPDHQKFFAAEVSIENESLGYGVGRSKKEAEQMAARNALELLQKDKEL